MNLKQLLTIRNINIIFIKKNIILLKIVTRSGIFFKICESSAVHYLFNFYNSLLLNNTNQFFTALILKNIFILFYSFRCYLKIRGLGFSFKYLELPKHTLLLNIGFSKVRYIQIPKIISLIKKPRKKKYIFILVSTNNNLLVNFNLTIRKLKKPDPYKLKGFRYIREALVVKTGKKKK
jgi:hypothetical protein